MEQKSLLLATQNPGKILEYRKIFQEFNLPVWLLTLEDFKIKDEPDEDGKTFKENAVKKVKFYSGLISRNIPVLAEDAGLEIDFLNGDPGILSRRWPGYKASDEELIRMTLEKLKGVPRDKRGAQLKVAIALYCPEENNAGKIHVFEGILRGYIAEKPIALRIPGYPFRTLFYVPVLDKVLGELTMEEEARIAHRKMALEKAIPILRKLFKLI